MLQKTYANTYGSFNEERVNSFKGINLTVAPELIDNGEARYQVNLTMEQLGKLVSRQGYTFAPFVRLLTSNFNLDLINYPCLVRLAFTNTQTGLNNEIIYTNEWGESVYANCYGVLAIGEYKLEDFWEEIDTDRLIVYAIRGDEEVPVDVGSIQDINNIKRVRGKLEFLFTPATGRYQNLVLDPYYLFSGRTTYDPNNIWRASGIPLPSQIRCSTAMSDILRQDIISTVSFVRLTAPNKAGIAYIPSRVSMLISQICQQNNANFDQWARVWADSYDKQYLTINQYRRFLVISDPINGDMILEDLWDTSDEDRSNRRHRLVLRPNTLERFDVNIVEIDPRFAEEQENDINKGVETGLALYQFVLPKRLTRVTEDHADPNLTNADWLDSVAVRQQSFTDDQKMSIKRHREWKVVQYMWDKKPSTLLSIVARSKPTPSDGSILPEIMAKTNYVNVNNLTHRIFSNVSDVQEFYDLLGELELKKDKVVKQEDVDVINVEEQRSSNVYIWQDFKVRYYPTLGIENLNVVYPYLLRWIDKIFDKTTFGGPRVQEIKPPDNAGRFAPLGVWRYKFVWDFGDGVYSAPSTPLVVPDIMWSATRDSEMDDGNLYYRFYNQTGFTKKEFDNFGQAIAPTDRDFDLTHTPPVSNVPQNLSLLTGQPAYLEYWFNHFGVPPTYLRRLRIYNSLQIDANGDIQATLTNYGNLLYRLKQRLYEGTGVKFGDFAGYFNSNNLNDLLQIPWFISNLPVIVTCNFGGDKGVPLKGVAWQFVKLDYEKWDETTAGGDLTIDGVTTSSGNFVFSDELQFNEGPMIVQVFPSLSMGRRMFSLCDWDGRFLLNLLPPRFFSDEQGNLIPNIRFFYTLPARLVASKRVVWTDNPDDSWEPPLFSQSWKLILDATTREYLSYIREGPFSTMEMYLGVFTPFNFNNLINEWSPSDPRRPLEIYGGPFTQFYFPFYGIDPAVARKKVDLYYILRPSSPVRALPIEHANHSLLIVGEDIPQEVIDRLILRGTIELHLVDKHEVIYPWSQSNYYPILGEGGYTRVYLDGILSSREYGLSKDNDPRYNNNANTPVFTEIGRNMYEHGASIYFAQAGDFTKLIYTTENIYNTYILGNVGGERVPVAICANQPDLYFVAGANSPEQLRNILYPNYVKRNWSPSGLPNYPDGRKRSYFRSLAAWDLYVQTNCLTNLDIYLYGEGERLTAPEQLSAYFPSSLLFRAPRLALKIDSQFIPRRAKRVLIFRTKNSHDNFYDPTDYGLVKEINIKWEGNPPIPITEVEQNGQIVRYQGIYFFDDVTDDNINYNIKPEEYEGLSEPLYSRFNIAVNERVYYYNFTRFYRPYDIRKDESDILPQSHLRIPFGQNQGIYENYYQNNIIPSVLSYWTFSTDPTKGYPPGRGWIIDYYFTYVDINGKIGRPSNEQIAPGQGQITITIPVAGRSDRAVVVFSLIPEGYDDTVEKVQIYRRIQGLDNNFWLIGEIEAKHLGVFVDDFLPSQKQLPSWDFERMEYPTGLRWSEPYRPDWIKGENFTEYKGGRTGTGLKLNYGNLILFTENSMARYTVQAQNPPISRVDEISQEVGCIAPNSICDTNNTLFFLSWKGWMSYNNNILKNIDEKFSPEIQLLLNYLPQELIREVTGGFNPYTNELWLNFPIVKSQDDKVNIPNVLQDKRIEDPARDIYYYFWGDVVTHLQNQKVWGHIYAVNILTGLGTKYCYQNTIIWHNQFNPWEGTNYSYEGAVPYHKIQIHPLGNIRLYYVDNNGDLRTGDIFPNDYPRYRTTMVENMPLISLVHRFLWAGLYIETPTPTVIENKNYYPVETFDSNNNLTTNYISAFFFDEDVVLRTDELFSLRTLWTRPGYQLTPQLNQNLWNWNPLGQNYFPVPKFVPIKWLFFSKFFAGFGETVLARLRKFNFNIYTKGPFVIRGIVFHRDELDTKIEDYNLAKPQQNVFAFDPSVDYYDRYIPALITGTNRNVYSVIFSTITNLPSGGLAVLWGISDDWTAKPVKTSVEIYGKKRAEIDEFVLYWRGIHTYLA